MLSGTHAELARMAAEAEASQTGGAAAYLGEEDDLQLGPEDAKYKTIEQMSADIKGLDEVRGPRPPPAAESNDWIRGLWSQRPLPSHALRIAPVQTFMSYPAYYVGVLIGV